MTGPEVEQAQCLLNQVLTGKQAVNLPKLVASFGPLTDSATRRFQSCAGITVDGQIGPETWAALDYWASQPGHLC